MKNATMNKRPAENRRASIFNVLSSRAVLLRQP